MGGIDEDDINLHFKFKETMFSVECFFNESKMEMFSFLHLKTALVMSYILSNSKSVIFNNNDL